MQLDHKKIAILATNGFEQAELEVPRDRLKAVGATVHIVSLEAGEIKGWDKKDWGRSVKVDKTLGQVSADDYDAVVLPGGQINPDLLRVEPKALSFIKDIFNQKKIVAALLSGQSPDPKYGQQSKERSVHNNYLTLPVIVLMISNHYPLLFATRYNWLIVAIVLLLGPVIRHFFNSRHAGKKSPWWVWIVAAAGMAAIALLSAAGPATVTTGALPQAATFAQVEEIVSTRCSMCHAGEPVWEKIVTAPKAILLDRPEHIHRNAKLIGRFAAWSSAMPPGNVTEMTGDERATVAAWLAAGAARD